MSTTQDQASRATTARGDRTRDAIRGSAAACFAELGYDGATTAEIGRRAGVSEASVFAHFGSKAGLLAAVMADFYDRLLDELRTTAEGPGDAVELLRLLVSVYAARLGAEWQVVQVFGPRARYGINPELTEDFRARNRQLTRAVFGPVNDLDDLPAALTPDLVRDAVLGAIEHTLLSQVTTGRAVDARPAARAVLDRLLGLDGSAAELGEVTDRLGRIEAKLDAALAREAAGQG